MSVISLVRERLNAAIDDVAAGVARFIAVLRRRRRIELVEQPDGSFLPSGFAKRGLQSVDGPLRFEDGVLVPPTSGRSRSLFAASAVEIVLAPSRFVFRPLELPRGADPFLEGVVRSQIDRLTPWSASEASFGWSRPVQQSSERLSVIVAATARARVAPISRAVLGCGADSVRLSTRTAEPERLPISMLDQWSISENNGRRLQRNLAIIFAVACIVFAFSFAAWFVVGGIYSARLADLQRQSMVRRAELMNRKSGGAFDAVRMLDARKAASPSAVMTLEAFSKILPDDAYLTELRIENGKAQMSGVARDAAALIGLIERSGRFTHATFYAPTVRNSDGGETFHIEGHIEPSFAGAN